MSSRFQTSLALKGATYTVITAAVFGLLVSAFQVWQNYTHRNENVEAAFSAIIATTLPSISLATYNFDMQLNQQLVNGLITHPEIISASIIDAKGSELALASKEKTCVPSNISIMLHGSNNQYEYALEFRDINLGKLVLELDTCKKTEQFFRDVFSSVLSNLALSISIAFFIYIVFYRLVSRPLIRLVSRLNKMDPTSIEYSGVNRLKSLRQDEIGALANRFADLLRTIHDHINRLKSAEKTINTYSSNLEELVGKRTRALTDINRQLKHTNTELEHTRQMSERLNQTRIRLLSNLSQEFTMPLRNTMQALISARQKSERTAEEEELILEALQQTETFLQLLGELENIANLSEENQKHCPFKMRTVFAHAEHKLHELLGQDYEIDLRIDDSLSDSHIGDANRTGQLMLNLIGNILRNTPAQRINIDVCENNRGIIIAMSAPGLAIPDTGFEQMILPMKTGEGPEILTAMGLALGKDLVELLGGHIRIIRNSQSENELHIELPLISCDDQLQKIRALLPEGNVRVHITGNACRQLVSEQLDIWNIPYQLSQNAHNKPVLLITDQNEFPEDTWQIISIGTSHPEGQPDDIPLTLIPSPADSGSLFEAIQHACTRVPLEAEYKQRIPRVLVVEDNTINRMLSQRYLKNLKADVETAEDGREAVNMANRSVYDLIFMDCQMPVMDGFQATREIRRSNLNQSTPIIALTSLESENERQACLQVGMNDFITKPFTQEQLQNAIIQWLPVGPEGR